MGLFVYIIVLIFETIYYTLFMKYAKNQGTFGKYLLLFSLINIFFFFISTDALMSYLLLVLMILYGMKYIVKVKVSLYDVFFIFVMMLLKLLIEITIALPLSVLINSIDISKISVGVIKCISIFAIKDRLGLLYTKLNICWNNNKFFIRYIFDILMFIYVIAACLFLINFR